MKPADLIIADQKAFAEIDDELARARRLHPEALSVSERLMTVFDEWVETKAAFLDNEGPARIREEAKHVATTAIRLMQEVEACG